MRMPPPDLIVCSAQKVISKLLARPGFGDDDKTEAFLTINELLVVTVTPSFIELIGMPYGSFTLTIIESVGFIVEGFCMLFIVNANLSSGLIVLTFSANFRSTRTVFGVVTLGSYEHITELSKAVKLEVQLKSELFVGSVI